GRLPPDPSGWPRRSSDIRPSAAPGTATCCRRCRAKPRSGPDTCCRQRRARRTLPERALSTAQSAAQCRRSSFGGAWLLSPFVVQSVSRPARYHCRRGASSLWPRLVEVPQIRRRLVLLGRHQIAVRADDVVLVADAHVGVVLGAEILAPERMRFAAAP